MTYRKGDKVIDSDGSALVLVKPHGDGKHGEWSAYDHNAGMAVRINEDDFRLAESAGPAPF